MSSHPYAFLVLFGIVAIAFPLVLLSVAQLWFKIFQPAKPSALKNAVYECGVPPTGARGTLDGHCFGRLQAELCPASQGVTRGTLHNLEA